MFVVSSITMAQQVPSIVPMPRIVSTISPTTSGADGFLVWVLAAT